MNKWIRFVLAMMIGAIGTFTSFAVWAEAKGTDVAKGKIVCIDPGHQQKADNGKEPIAPGSKTMKAKVSSGTQGVATKKPEYALNLEVALLLKKKLEQEGYKVVSREKNEVHVSNKERAIACNQAKANLAIRIHADGDAKAATSGFSVLYPKPTASTKSIVALSKRAATSIEKAIKADTGAKSRGIVARGDLTGFNWSTIPVVVVEMGFMTNPKEDKLLSKPEYKAKMASGLQQGIHVYFAALTDSRGKQ